jgi:hypothetical protein
MPKKERKWTVKDNRNLVRFLLMKDKEILFIYETEWSCSDKYDINWKKYVEGKK